LNEITGVRPPIASSLDNRPGPLLAVGKKMCERAMPRLLEGRNLAEEGYVIKSVDHAGKICVAVAGATPRGTNCGLATLMSRIRVEGASAQLEGLSELEGTPRFALRGIHLNGWPINYPYAFRAWQESD
jgi:alpha-glucuronidase